MTLPLLAVDTAAARLQLALLTADRLETLVEPMAQGQAERLFPAVDDLLARVGLHYADLKRVAVTTGPGSFTGLRIGLSAARGLGLALGIPVLGIPTMSAISLLAPEGTQLAVLIDAKRGEMYRGDFAGPLLELNPLNGSPRPIAEAFAGIGVQHGLRHLLGSGAAAAAEATGAVNLELDRPEADRGFVDIDRVARWAADAIPESWPPVPAYGRGADAKPQDRFRVERTGA